MGVVVMEMVTAAAAGVLYTDDPRAGGAAVIHAVCGLGSLAVEGVVAPDIYTVAEDRLVASHVGEKTRMHVPAPGAGTCVPVFFPTWLAARRSSATVCVRRRFSLYRQGPQAADRVDDCCAARPGVVGIENASCAAATISMTTTPWPVPGGKTASMAVV